MRSFCPSPPSPLVSGPTLSVLLPPFPLLTRFASRSNPSAMSAPVAQHPLNSFQKGRREHHAQLFEQLGPSVDYHAEKTISNAASTGYDAAYLDKLYVENTEKHGLPPISVPRSDGKFLYLQTKLTRAKRIIEVGMLGGYSTLWMAYALPPDGKLTAYDISPKAAEIARANFDGAGEEISKKIDIVVGPAAEELAKVPTPTSREEEVDLVFIDADKDGYPAYFEQAKRLAPHGLVVRFSSWLTTPCLARPCLL